MSNLINISDHPTLGLKRKVEWTAFIYSDKESYVKLFTICHHFENNGGSYGDPFESNAVKDFERILMASNSRLVNPLSGVVCNLNNSGSYVDFQGNTVANPMGQFDFFKNLVDNQQIVISDIASNTVVQEDMFFKSYD